jgi:hypothetical protein
VLELFRKRKDKRAGDELVSLGLQTIEKMDKVLASPRLSRDDRAVVSRNKSERLQQIEDFRQLQKGALTPFDRKVSPYTNFGDIFIRMMEDELYRFGDDPRVFAQHIRLRIFEERPEDEGEPA